ncbi:MAG: hypothetical protein II919_02610 [Lachnospiraceae bacterium]|nr:hypothetical protein [Lachnospiraceae bacterium]MBQ3664983.1 hypothetical protein [Lachnospiraceae bacterium]
MREYFSKKAVLYVIIMAIFLVMLIANRVQIRENGDVFFEIIEEDLKL